MGAYYHMLKHQSTQKKNTWASILAFDLADYIMQPRDLNLTLGGCSRNRKRFQLKLKFGGIKAYMIGYESWFKFFKPISVPAEAAPS